MFSSSEIDQIRYGIKAEKSSLATGWRLLGITPFVWIG
jgi:hypothetical protein